MGRYDPEKEKFKRQELQRVQREDELRRYKERFTHDPTGEPSSNEDLINDLKKLKRGEEQ
jgi:hypothetical protein